MDAYRALLIDLHELEKSWQDDIKELQTFADEFLAAKHYSAYDTTMLKIQKIQESAFELSLIIPQHTLPIDTSGLDDLQDY